MDAIRERQIADNASGFGFMDLVHGALDVAGFIPGLGAVADVLNAGIYALEGDYANAALSLLAAVPGVGDAAALGKMAMTVAVPLAMVAKHSDEVVDVARAAPRFVTTPAGITIDRLSVRTTVSAQRQGRHVLNAPQYRGGSYFESAGDAQRVLDDFHSGQATVLGVKGNDIMLRTDSVTGINVNRAAGYPHQPTDVFFIKGTTSPSVVPTNPTWGR